jgi:ferritin
MLKLNVSEAINRQINAELYSAYLYLSMAAGFESRSLTGMANWLKVQAQEELGHAMKFFGHVIERGGTVTLGAIEAPPVNWDSALVAFEDAYQHECHITGLIHKLVDLAGAEKDHALGVLLQWFVKEQVEEEVATLAIVERLRMVGDSKTGLLMIDHQLGHRKAGS